MEFQRADEVARGRVWIGSDARQLGLVDTLGDLPGAIDAAAKRAGLDPDTYGVKDVEPELSVPLQLIREFGVRLLTNLGRLGLSLPAPAPASLGRWIAAGEREFKALAALNDPRGIYYLCSCVMR
jgi:protease-4